MQGTSLHDQRQSVTCIHFRKIAEAMWAVTVQCKTDATFGRGIKMLFNIILGNDIINEGIDDNRTHLYKTLSSWDDDSTTITRHAELHCIANLHPLIVTGLIGTTRIQIQILFDNLK